MQKSKYNSWDYSYQQGVGINKWPFSNAITYLSRIQKSHYVHDVLELGFGTGPNIVISRDYKWKYTGIELSKQAYEIASKNLVLPNARLINADLTQVDLAEYGDFDLIYDRATLTHLPCQEIRRTVEQIYNSLRIGGIFLGLDWFSSSYHEKKNGTVIRNMECTRGDFKTGQFESFEITHFTDYQHIKDIFAKFTPLAIRHLEVTEHESMPSLPADPSVYNFVMHKI